MAASYLETAVEIAREAGSLLANFFERRVKYEIKGDQDLVTEADRASEQLILERLHSHFPSHSIVAEESGRHDRSSEFCWYVDPLDGTTNFAHGFPTFNVTMGLEQNGEMICGVVYDPSRQETFTAEKGAGAYLNHRRIHVSKAARLDEALLTSGFPTRRRHLDVNFHFFYQLAMITHGMRRTGSAAIDLANVASGRTDGFWEFGLSPWDMAAGILLVREAGGQITDMRGGAHHLKARHMLATNGAIHAETIALFGEIFDGRGPYPLVGVREYSN